MPVHSGSKNDEPDRAAGPHGRPERPLGRGLEDISHLFLSRRASDRAPAADERPGGAAGRARLQADADSPPPAPDPPRTIVLRRQSDVSRDRLAAALTESVAVLEDGLRVIDANVPCEPFGDVDLVAVDAMNHLVLIDFDPASGDALLLRGMGHFDWSVRNAAIVRRMYQGHAVDLSQQPRLVLVAPRFSPLVRRVARLLARPQIVWKRFIAVDVAGRTGILFDEVEGE
jgi:hypothetical protein